MKSNHKPLIVAVFLVFSGLISRAWYIKSTNSFEVSGFLGNPTAADQHYSSALFGVAEAHGVEGDNSALVQGGGEVATITTSENTAGAGDSVSRQTNYIQAEIYDPGQPVGQSIDPIQSTRYTVKKGDTFSTIAAHFNISVAHILSANPNISKKSVKVGQIILVPGTTGSSRTANSVAASLPNFNSDFIAPSQGYNNGILDDNNGVNIQNSCGTSVVAAADGVVVPDPNISQTLGGWNGGYGNFVLLEQPFGNEIFTRYSHLEEALVQIGDYVKQGQQIGLIGQTGGAPDCELNFQVIGAQNPLAR